MVDSEIEYMEGNPSCTRLETRAKEFTRRASYNMSDSTYCETRKTVSYAWTA